MEPALRQYEADAKSCAVHARWDWYEKWLPCFITFRADLGAVAERHGLDGREVVSTAVAYLRGVYATERGRQERRAGRQSTAAEHGQGQGRRP
jgi:hypothetical protein